MSDERMVQFSAPFYAGEHERFAEDVQLPAPGAEATLRFADGSFPVTIASATRVSDTELRITYAVPADSGVGRFIQEMGFGPSPDGNGGLAFGPAHPKEEDS